MAMTTETAIMSINSKSSEKFIIKMAATLNLKKQDPLYKSFWDEYTKLKNGQLTKEELKTFIPEFSKKFTYDFTPSLKYLDPTNPKAPKEVVLEVYTY